MALMFAASETLAKSGPAFRGGGAAIRAKSHAPFAHSFRHHRRAFGTFFPAAGLFYTPPNGEPVMEVPQVTSTDVRYTYTYDVPWDWAHRYPPAVEPSARPYVSSCSSETVTVPGRSSNEQTVNVMRCY